MRQVVWVAKRFRGRGVPFADLVQEGAIGLAKAVDKWDPERGELSTVSTWWIRKQIQVAISGTGDAIRIPTHVEHRRALAMKFIRTRPEATQAEIAEAIGCEPEQVGVALELASVVASLDREIPSGEGYAEALAQLLADPYAEDPADFALREDPTVRAAIVRLEDEQRSVIEMRYGFTDQGPMSFAEIGEELGLPREQVSKKHASAMARLRRCLDDRGMIEDIGVDNEGRSALVRGLGGSSATGTAQPGSALDPSPDTPSEEEARAEGLTDVDDSQ